MSKAMLILDEMPESCDQCIIQHEDYGVCLNKERPTPRKSNKRPDWCPLKEMPERREALADVPWQNGYKFGWNGCLKAIGGLDE